MLVSGASELLFEDIKKLNAQQRPDVPTCLIYAAVSPLLPVSTKQPHISASLAPPRPTMSLPLPLPLLLPLPLS